MNEGKNGMFVDGIDQSGVEPNVARLISVLNLSLQNRCLRTANRCRVRVSEEDWSQKVNPGLVSPATQCSPSEQQPVDLVNLDDIEVQGIDEVGKVNVSIFERLSQAGTIFISDGPCIENDIMVTLVEEGSEKVED